MRISLSRAVVAAVVVALLSATAAPAASAHTRVLMLHPKWHRTSILSPYVQASGQWVLLAEDSSGGAGTLINEKTGAERSVSRPAGCYDPPALGPSSLVFRCSDDDVTVVSLATRASDEIPISSQLTSWEADCEDNLIYDDEYSCGLSASGIGSHWIEFDESCGEHCLEPPAKPNTYFFQNISTGEVRSDPTGGSTYADPSAPGLARTLCSPLRIPNVPEAYVDGSGAEEPGLGSVGLDGRFAVVAGGRFGDTYDLEKCGSKLKESLATAASSQPTYNSHVVLWEIKNEVRSKCGTDGEFDGLFLPDRRKFILCVPSALFSADYGSPDQIVLTSRTLFVCDDYGPLWEAPSPVEPRPQAAKK